MPENDKLYELPKKLVVITCPHCGHQYMPDEIFMPGELTGKSETVIKDPLGKIIYADYKEDYEPTTEAHYICDNCEKPFIVKPTVLYTVSEEYEELDFSEETTSLI